MKHTNTTTNASPATTEQKKLPPMRSSLATHAELLAMVRAMRAEPVLNVIHNAEAGTVDVYVTRNSRLVFSAIQKGDCQPWIVRMMDGLLSIA